MKYLLALLLSWGVVQPTLAQSCRIAFDVGSSGIRAGSDVSGQTAKAEIDYLADLWPDGHLDTTLPATEEALRRLPEQAGLAVDCRRVAGGFSAWRLALELGNRQDVADLLAGLYRQTGVPLLVIPQRVEGSYGYRAARQVLRDGLNTPLVLDIGGGSLQVSGEAAGWGRPLGQKVWNRQLCGYLRQAADSCDLSGMTAVELAQARQWARKQLSDLSIQFPSLGLTAISRPVTRGIYPAVGKLVPEAVTGRTLSMSGVRKSLEQLAPMVSDERARAVSSEPKYVIYLVSDMLLLEGIMDALGLSGVEVAEGDITNLPGLLADDRAFAWGAHYGCYLERLRVLGEIAYDGDPENCRDQ